MYIPLYGFHKRATTLPWCNIKTPLFNKTKVNLLTAQEKHLTFLINVTFIIENPDSSISGICQSHKSFPSFWNNVQIICNTGFYNFCLKLNVMLWQCRRRAMKRAVYVTIHENSYVRADIVYYVEFYHFLLAQKLSNSHKVCIGHMCVHHPFATTFVWTIFHSINAVSYAQGMCRDACSQWHTQEFCSGGSSTNSVEGRENGDLGGSSPIVRGSAGSCNLVQEISFNIVKFS